MGLDNRDYMRDEAAARQYYGGGGGAMSNIVKTLIIVNAFVFLGQIFIQVPISRSDFPLYFDTDGFSEQEIDQGYQEVRDAGRLPRVPLLNMWFTLDSTKVFQGQIWRITTYDFLHSTDSIWHIFFNMFLLYLAGKPVADKYGQLEFLWFYLFAGAFSAVFYIAWGLLNRENVAAVGASGAVSAILVLYAMNWPQHRWYIYGIIPIPAIVLVLVSAGMDLMPMLRQITTGVRTDHIAHSAHIGGMLFGYLYYRNRWRLSELTPTNWIRIKRKPKLKVHRPVESPPQPEAPAPKQPIPAEISQRVDELLEKISRSGEASLTEEERNFLHESSRKYR